MAQHEVECFACALGCELEAISAADFIHSPPSEAAIEAADMLLFGGSGDYSVAAGGEWLPEALEMMRTIVQSGVPTFASCWGFQAIAKALGGEVETDLSRAEVGTFPLNLTSEGERDPFFSSLGSPFWAQMGHQDIVTKLPPEAVLLASSEKVPNQAFKIPGKPVYCTQFHPELTRDDLVLRLEAYPKYVKDITGLPMEEFLKTTRETPQLKPLIRSIRDELLKR